MEDSKRQYLKYAGAGLAAQISLPQLPLSDELLACVDRDTACRYALSGGDDYELCFTASPGEVDAHRSAFEGELGVPLTQVGRVEEGSGAVVVDEEGEPMQLRGFQHWEDA